ncbi:MAG TPA: S8/S53 family peptidase [Streptosporangiaceae bacterium]
MDSDSGRAGREPPKLDIQTELIVSACQAKGIDVGVARLPDGSLDFLYQRGVILVRSSYLDRVGEIVGAGEGGDEEGQAEAEEGGDRSGHDHSIEGITRYSLAGARISDTLEALRAIDRELGPGIATPNHVFSITPVYPCPATEPAQVPPDMPPDPGVCDASGTGVFIYVPDTGLLEGAASHPWLAGVAGLPDELPPPDSNGVVMIPEYTGHGTFVAGVARCMAPASTVSVTDDFTTAGVLSEFEVVLRLNLALGLGVNIISLSAGGTTRHNLPPLSFEGFWSRYRSYKGVLLVAAAGNNSTRRPFWPAAFPQVVGVGALAANGRGRAYFSDFGPWVDVYAPGEDLINAYAVGTYKYREPPRIGQEREFHGMARWSGTSFATPLVAGLVAARMTRTGENARQAADALLATARAQQVPGLGPVLLPCDRGDCDRGPAHCGCCGCQARDR